MKTNYNFNEMIKLNAIMQSKLQDLMVLDKKRAELIKRAEELKSLTPEIQREMEESLSQYTALAEEISSLKAKAKQLKTKK